jgi:hypothetical protein
MNITTKTPKCAFLVEAYSNKKPQNTKTLDFVLEFCNSEPSRIMCPLYGFDTSGNPTMQNIQCGYNNRICLYTAWKSLK